MRNSFLVLIGLFAAAMILFAGYGFSRSALAQMQSASSTAPLPSPTPSEDDLLRQQINEKQQLIQQLEGEAQRYRDSIAQTSSQAKTLKSQLAAVDSQIKSLQYSISITQTKLEQTNLKIEDLNGTIQSAEDSIANNQTYLTGLLQTLRESDDQNGLISFLKTDKLSDAFSQLAYLDNLQQTVMEKTAFLKTLKENMQNNLDQAVKSKQQYDSLKQQLVAQKAISNEQQQEKTTLLANTKNQEQAYQKMLNDTIAKQKQIQDEIENIESRLRKTANYTGIPPKGSKIFIIPVGESRITQGYGPVPRSSETRKFYAFHNGIDYASRQGMGAPLYAAADGVVNAVGDNGKYAYGKWITINHENGLITLYSHLSYIKVKVGQRVKQGDVIGYLGATGLVTGPHVHFTVYLADKFSTTSRWYGLLPVGASVDPNDYL